jgi:NAD(P)H-dependent flavin oxidoreductase YrpB (nitropropane dioxygenase family)
VSGAGVLHTPFCELVGVEHPIVQTGMGWVSGARLTAATANAGALGILASATMTYDQLVTAIGEVKDRTVKPFGVNFRADAPDLDARVALVIREQVKVASFATPPAPAIVAELREAGVVTIPTIGARRHAEKMAGIGVSAVIAQGQEGGGHTGEVPTSLLVPDAADAVDIPVVGAGGFRDGRGLVAALAWGAQAIAMGTRFLLTQESTVPDNVKAQYLAAKVTDTVRTSSIDGHPQRVIRTEMVDELERASIVTRLPKAAGNALRFRKLTGTSLRALLTEGLAMRKNQGLTWSQLAMAANAPMLTKAAMVDGHPEVGILPTGQVVGEIDELPTVDELVQRIIAEATDTLDRLRAG